MRQQTFQYIIDGQRRQYAIDDVFTSIKEVKAELKGSSFEIPISVKEIIDLVQSDPLVFEAKFVTYNDRLIQYKSWIENPTVPDKASIFSDVRFRQLYFSIEHTRIGFELPQLEKLVNLLRNIIEKHSIKDIAEFYKLEKEYLHPQTIFFDNDFDFVPSFTAVSERDELILLLRGLRKKLKIVIGFKYTKINRDLRQSFRNLIRFLFKNMSDESGENSVLLYADCKQTSFTNLTLNTHELRRTYQ